MNIKNKWLVGSVSSALIAGAVTLEGDYNKYLDPYKDTGGIPTVCTGHTGPDVKMGVRWTPNACKEVLIKDLVKHGNGILDCVDVPLTLNQYNAFTLFAYNVGVSAFCKSNTVAKQLNAGNYTEACNGMYKWVYVNSNYSKGLYNRRKIEVAMCLAK